jgi:hypothetical protein
MQPNIQCWLAAQRDFGPNDPLTWLAAAEIIEVSAPSLKKLTDKELDDAERVFLSNATQGTTHSRYSRKNPILRRLRRQSDSALDDIGNNAEATRRATSNLGVFTGYTTRGVATTQDTINDSNCGILFNLST